MSEDLADIKRLAGLSENDVVEASMLQSNATIKDVVNLLAQLRAEAKDLMVRRVDTGGLAGSVVEHLWEAIQVLERIEATIQRG